MPFYTFQFAFRQHCRALGLMQRMQLRDDDLPLWIGRL